MPTRLRTSLAIAALVVVGAAAGLTASSLTPVRYAASATVFVSTRTPVGGAELVSGNPFPQQVADAYAQVATTPLVLKPVISELRLRTSVPALATRVRAERESGTSLIRISATDPSAPQAAAIANAVRDRLVAEGAALSPSGPSSAQVSLDALDRAAVPTAPAGPGPLLEALIGALAGLAVYGVVAVVLLLRGARRPPGGGLATPAMA